MVEFLGALGGIILVDLALSGDNALVIGAAAAGLPPRQRTYAIAIGGAGAVMLRIAFAIAATLLLQLPFLQAIGGLALLLIAVCLLAERDSANAKQGEQGDEPAPLVPRSPKHSSPAPPRGFAAALLTILVADVTMSLDNVLAIGALAHGNVLVLGFGLLVSIALVLAGSALVAGLIRRLPWLLDVAALVLGWTGPAWCCMTCVWDRCCTTRCRMPRCSSMRSASPWFWRRMCSFACETGRQPADRERIDDGPAVRLVRPCGAKGVAVVFGSDNGSDPYSLIIW